MLDQSFTPENFRRIFDYENRKGVYLEKVFFPDLVKLTQDIKNLTVEIRATYREADKQRASEVRAEKYEKRKCLKEEKESKLNSSLTDICDRILERSFQIRLTKNVSILDKPVYTQERIPEVYFALKQLQYNFAKLYKVKQSNRYEILKQVKNLLGDGFPKFIIRTDIKSFYESIPSDKLQKKINEESLLSFFSKRLITKIIKEYEVKSDTKKGLPRGIGISAYLAELYLRDLDKEIMNLPHVVYYARYVDDIIVMFVPPILNSHQKYLDEVKAVIESDKFDLPVNIEKTFSFDLREENSRQKHLFDYLGYKFSFGFDSNNKPIPVELNLADKKLSKYQRRINSSLKCYVESCHMNEKWARKILVKRIRFLTSNTRLKNNKKNILVGIYYSHSLLTNLIDLEDLDAFLSSAIESANIPSVLKRRLLKNSFKIGFVDKKFIPFSTKDLHQIMTIWKRN